MTDVTELMRAADAYAADHYIEGRWADSREALERSLADALTVEPPSQWQTIRAVGFRLVAFAAAAGFAYASWQQFELKKEVRSLRTSLVEVSEHRDRLAGQSSAATSAGYAYRLCDPANPPKGIWMTTGDGRCWEVR